jgi:hypothetical protein
VARGKPVDSADAKTAIDSRPLKVYTKKAGTLASAGLNERRD